jgi:hypothetical protein
MGLSQPLIIPKIFLLSMGLLGSRPSYAKCADRTAFLSPAPGTPLTPTQGVYLFDPSGNGSPPTVVSSTGHVAVIPMAMTDRPNYRVFLIAPRAPIRSRTVTITVRHSSPTSEDAINRPMEAVAGLDGISGVFPIKLAERLWPRRMSFAKIDANVEGTAPYFRNATVSLQPSVEAPAYRVFWAESEAHYARGDVKTVVLPRVLGHFSTLPPPKNFRAPLLLGETRCTGRITTWPGVSSNPIFASIVPLFGFRTEPSMPRKSVRIDPPERLKGNTREKSPIH